ncbi:MAG: tetratricopeptide repeat protein [Deltaproteobacteria bacterium]|nr:tetratricopeptide repeat protein [Deltaproteobacteria bacterium]
MGEFDTERTALFGRDAELAAVRAALAEGRVVAVVGSAGVGKSRLAREVARGVAAAGRVVLTVPAAAATSRAVLAASLLDALGVPLGEDGAHDELFATAADHLRRAARPLLVVETVEQLAGDTAAGVAQLVAAVPELHALVCARVAPELPGARAVAVGPLRRPEPGEPPEANPGVRLFYRLAANLGARIGATPADLAAVADLVRALGGLPLAIELAAAWAPVTPLAALRARFAAPRAAADPVQDAVASAWEGLSDGERHVVELVARLPQGLDVAAAERRLAGALGLADLAAGLVHRSVLLAAPGRADHAAPDASPRLVVADVVRAWALGPGRSRGRAAGALDEALLTWLEGLAEDAARGAAIPVEDLRNALAVASGPQRSARARARAADAVLALAPALSARLPYEELAASVHVPSDLDAGRRVGLILVRVAALARLSAADAARAALTEALDVARAAGSRALEGRVLVHHTLLVEALTAAETAGHMRDALAVLGPRGDRTLRAEALTTLAFTLGRLGDHGLAEERFAAAMALLGPDEGGASIGRALNNWAVHQSLRGRAAAARDALLRALAIAERGGHALLECAAACSLGEAALQLGDLVAARDAFERSLAVARRLGYRRHARLAAAYLGAVAHFRADPASALRRYDEALAVVAGGWDDAPTRGLVLSARALALAQLGRRADSEDAFERARAVLDALANPALSAASDLHRLAAAVASGRLAPGAALAAAAGIQGGDGEGAELFASHVVTAKALLRLIAGQEQEQERAQEPPTAAAEPAARRLLIGPATRWLELPDGTRCDLARSPRSRGIVDALVAAFEARPGAAVAADALIAAAWPGDATPEPHRSNRLYVAVTRLRAQGLGDLVRHDGDGYLLDPAVVVARDGPQKT